MKLRRASIFGVWLAVAWMATGCASRPVNPSFAVSEAEAKAVLEQIEKQDPRPFDRPVVVMAGWADPGFENSYWVKQLRRAGAADDQVLGFKFVFKGDFARCRTHVVDAVQEAWPSDDPAWTTEVDVVAFSMGGLVARYSASPVSADDGPPLRRLNIRHLYTISTPHLGAVMAGVPTFDRRVIDMRAGSDFLARLDEALVDADYTLTAYTRLHDPIVGSDRTAPEGVTPWWVDTPFLHRAHQEAYRDPRIRADILRRLRGEPPLTEEPAAALPE